MIVWPQTMNVTATAKNIRGSLKKNVPVVPPANSVPAVVKLPVIDCSFMFLFIICDAALTVFPWRVVVHITKIDFIDR